MNITKTQGNYKKLQKTSKSKDKQTLVLFLFCIVLVASHFLPEKRGGDLPCYAVDFSQDKHGVFVYLNKKSLFSENIPADTTIQKIIIPHYQTQCPKQLTSLEPEKMPAEITPFFRQALPINSVDKETLRLVPGISLNLAERIIEERNQRGGFKKPEDLQGIPGLGAKRTQTLLAHIFFDNEE